MAGMPLNVYANHIQAENVTITHSEPDDWCRIKFDISWDNSWKDTTNRDAAWVFVKYKKSGGAWKHATLSDNSTKHIAPSGSTIDAPSGGKGIFIYRSSDDTGSVDWNNIFLRWNYGTDGISKTDTVKVKVFAIEMVYIPEGSFALHTGGDGASANFEKADGTISSENALAEGAITWDRSESSWCGAGTSDGSSGYNAALVANYPKGYKAIYCMKYEISQGQYADFLSLLTDAQDNNRYPGRNGNYRHTITGTYGSYSASVPDRACNYLNWADGLACADWAGLRPMTELEFEKICRGSESAGTDYAWGSTTITAATTISGTENGTETITNSNANCCYNDIAFMGGDGGKGPLRCGIFATGSSTRQQSGASYYGVMEMSGNLWERCITVAKYCWNNSTWNNETGAGSFDGQHGDGSFTGTGFADVTNWPSPTVTSGSTALGAGVRGGSWYHGSWAGRVSDRDSAASAYAARDSTYGFRCVRSAP